MTIRQLPEWDGQARDMGKGSRMAVCRLTTHPIGGEVRLDVDGEMLRTGAERESLSACRRGAAGSGESNLLPT